jgi:hypothetical protein
VVLNYTVDKNLFGKLIDFDYGGEIKSMENGMENAPKYPNNYVHSLKDGFRQGRPGETITFEHDWRALSSVILQLYTLIPGSIPEDDNEYDKLSKRKNQLKCMRDAFLYCNDSISLGLMHKAFAVLGEKCTIIPSEKPGLLLRKYLVVAQKNDFELRQTDIFHDNLKDCHMIESKKTTDDFKWSYW